MAKKDSTSGIKFSLDDGKFLCPVTETSMAPRYRPGEFFLVDTDELPEIDDDVLVRLATGKTMLKRLVEMGNGITLADYEDGHLLMLESHEVTHCLYVAHRVTARNISERYGPFQ